MCRKMHTILLATLALCSLTTARFINDNDIYDSLEISREGNPLNNYISDENPPKESISTEEDDGALPLYRIVGDSDKGLEELFGRRSKEFDDSPEDDDSSPELDERIGIPVDYDNSNTRGVVLRNKFGGDEDNGEENNPGWLRRQWRRLGNVASAVAKGREISANKVNEVTEKICALIKFMTTRASKICELVPLKMCEPFYGKKNEEEGNIVMPPYDNPLDISNNIKK